MPTRLDTRSFNWMPPKIEECNQTELYHHHTESARIGHTVVNGGAPPTFSFSGRHFTDPESNLTNPRGCGITPQVWPDADPRISEVPITSREDLQWATTSIAQFGGVTPRRGRPVHTDVADHARLRATWSNHHHDKPLRVAGISTARLGHNGTAAADRQGVDDRPTILGWSENETLPGGYHYSPRRDDGQSAFGRRSNFTQRWPAAGRH